MTRRERTRLNSCLHELRRPLQRLALDRYRPEVDVDLLELVLAALDDLDVAVNGGGRRPSERRPLSVAAVLESLVVRWADRTSLALPVEEPALRAWILADPVDLARALDNLVANALEYGRHPVGVSVAERDGRVRFTVRDAGTPVEGPGPRHGDPRRGHGLRVVAEIAGREGGRAWRRFGADRSVAVLELPSASPG